MSFEEIYDTYYSKIFRLCMGYMNDHDWAQDVTQETFITVWQKLSQFRNESTIGTWIYRIASNHCLRQLEKQSKMPKGEMPVQLEDKPPPDTDSQVQLLYKCIAELPEIDRIIISLELEDVKQAEIANIVGLSETNIRVKVYRIKEKLSQKFKKYEHQY
ncbi:RNA polymerase sigma-70 factor, ECF subfamily [Mucilaginibacter sp. OK268]|jgi:RNA polymerase sigma-70 factor (ECF subfamily)|uniref:RNA polymerase sigma factor n=1 Tax=Mucilaginibacter sp. OK268 TaxID=1881048 RepID=UPI0008896C4C|nr:RNA polymerase sigma factor [Mucilaginibacter sp. OK268]SDQ01258.1 RNA polymerase sigma-70 factor, ECF subfamily [Mucilaginibacter sp. OK268]